MILPDFFLESRQFAKWDYSGLDSFSRCLDKKHFKSYPYEVSYEYNSRGFRDEEWPESLSELRDAIWCFGDSFTVGVGCPIEHTWPRILQERTGKRCINVSMDGASNKWIARKVKQVIDEINPKHIVIQWSFALRDEHIDTSLSDEDRRIHANKDDLLNADPMEKFASEIKSADSPNTIHSVIPPIFDHHYSKHDLYKIWDDIKGESWPVSPPATEQDIPLEIKKELEECFVNEYADIKQCYKFMEITSDLRFVQCNQVDYSRDGFHYDIKTATSFVDNVIAELDN